MPVPLTPIPPQLSFYDDEDYAADERPVNATLDAVLMTALVSAGVCMGVAAMVGHGVLRPMLEARGVTPWTVRDSLGSMPLVLFGAAACGAGGSVGTYWLTGVSGAIIPSVHPSMLAAMAVALVLIGLLVLRLGLLALRKLT